MTTRDHTLSRDQLAKKITLAELGIPVGLCSLLVATVPDTVALYMEAHKDPRGIAQILHCLKLDVNTTSDSLAGQDLTYCVCTGQWVTSYLVVFGVRRGVWSVIWDTTLSGAIPAPIADTLRLGIEESGWPTLSAKGLASAKGAQEHILIHWNGSTGHLISPTFSEPAMAGDFLETVDLNGDGILEIVAWVREDARGTKYLENVFAFDKAQRIYKHIPTLKSGKLTPRDRTNK